jgi:hypothetical protein
MVNRKIIQIYAIVGSDGKRLYRMETDGKASDILVSDVSELPLYIATPGTPINFRPTPEEEVCFDFIPPHNAFRPSMMYKESVDFFRMLPLTEDEIERFLAKIRSWNSLHEARK